MKISSNTEIRVTQSKVWLPVGCEFIMVISRDREYYEGLLSPRQFEISCPSQYQNGGKEEWFGESEGTIAIRHYSRFFLGIIPEFYSFNFV